MADVQEIVSKLLERTNQGKINWRPTASEDTFVATIGYWSVNIAIPRHINLPVIRIYDGSGQLLEELCPLPNEASGSRLRELHRKAKRNALGIDRQLEGLLAELDRV